MFAIGWLWLLCIGTPLSISMRGLTRKVISQTQKEPLRKDMLFVSRHWKASPEITSQSTLWIAALGLQSRPTTQPTSQQPTANQPTSDIRSWNQSKVPRLEQIMNELARTTEPAPATLIIFSGETEHVSITCDAADRAFANRIQFVVASEDPDLYCHISKRFRSLFRHYFSSRTCARV